MSGRGRPTSTSRFGVGKRESHDASDFYARFGAKELSNDERIAGSLELGEPIVCGDSREMRELPDGSVALVVTSPPYFAGKEYEEALGQGAVPASYAEYLEMLRDVLAECRRVLEPGGRIAVNVANLGRKPYRSLSGDVARILDDDLGLLLRGEVVWAKAEGASGSCAWGSYRSPANPVLRDLTERVVIASKGRFDRAMTPRRRRERGYPSEATISADEFMDATLDVWRIPSESARRVGHPAPFPVELPLRLIDLYTYEGDLVLDPFIGSGTTAVAALRSGRRYVGYDTDPDYVKLARRRIRSEIDQAEARSPVVDRPIGTFAADVLEEAGFVIREKDHAVPGLGLTVSLLAVDADDACWYFDVTGSFTTASRSGLVRPDTLWKSLGQASVLAAQGIGPLVLLTSDLPPPGGAGDGALRSLGPSLVHDAIELRSPDGRLRLARYAKGGRAGRPVPGFWSDADIGV